MEVSERKSDVILSLHNLFEFITLRTLPHHEAIESLNEACRTAWDTQPIHHLNKNHEINGPRVSDSVINHYQFCRRLSGYKNQHKRIGCASDCKPYSSNTVSYTMPNKSGINPTFDIGWQSGVAPIPTKLSPGMGTKTCLDGSVAETNCVLDGTRPPVAQIVINNFTELSRFIILTYYNSVEVSNYYLLMP